MGRIFTSTSPAIVMSDRAIPSLQHQRYSASIASRSQDQLDVTQAEAETVIQPGRLLDDLSWKVEAAAGTRGCRHTNRLPCWRRHANLTTPWPGRASCPMPARRQRILRKGQE